MLTRGGVNSSNQGKIILKPNHFQKHTLKKKEEKKPDAVPLHGLL